MSVFLPKRVASFKTSSGFIFIALTTNNKEVIRSSMVNKSFFCGLGFRQGFYKIKNICIKLNTIHKYNKIKFLPGVLE